MPVSPVSVKSSFPRDADARPPGMRGRATTRSISPPDTRRGLASIVLALALSLTIAAVASEAIAKSAANPAAIRPTRSSALHDYATLPLSFIENRGQVDERARFYVQGLSYSLFFTADGHALRLVSGSGEHAKAHVVRVELVGAETRRIESRQPATGIVSYFTGPKSEWKAGIPTHARIGYVEPWPGIDLAYDGDGGKLESIYTVAPRADPARIQLRYKGHESLKIDRDGSLVYRTSAGPVTETAPILYQDIDGERVRVKGRYRLVDSDTVGFEVAKYDRDRALVIDPTLVYAGYIGGSGSDDAAAIAVDSTGNAYVTGSTSSTAASFPEVTGPDLTANGSSDAFVAKISADGSALVYAGFIGGSGSELGRGIAVDGDGNAYVTGFTQSTEATFPVLVGPDLTTNGSQDAFVAKVNAAGTALVYAGFIGGAQVDASNAVAVDTAGNAYVAGGTFSTEATFPVLGGPDLSANGQGDGFVTKVNPSGSALVYSGFVGGSQNDGVNAIAVDSAGRAVVVGSSDFPQTGFPVTVGPSLIHGGQADAFVARLSPSGAGFEYAGFVGGSSSDGGSGVAVDASGSAYVTGFTDSTESSFPETGGPDLSFNGISDAFVAKVNPAGSALVYAGYIGGSAIDSGVGIAVDAAGVAYVTGFTASTEATFPVVDGPDLIYNGGVRDAFVAKVRADGTALDYATYIGGATDDRGFGIAVGSAGNVYVTGSTTSTAATFPVVAGPDLVANGASDAFVALIREPSSFIFGDGFE